MKKIKILDCTLRDGGFYNKWDFDLDAAKDLVASLNKSGVDLIELGYKSPDRNRFYGLFKYSNEKLLSFVREYSQCEYAFMIDAKEFIDGEEPDYELLDEHVLPESESVFSWVRIASRAIHAGAAPGFIRYFKEKGYRICFNLMGGSMVPDEELVRVLELLEGKGLDVFYIADSYGSFYPSDVRRKMKLIRKHFTGLTGVHLHDNQGLAYANAIAAIEEGVDVVDATVMGMGRGAGNLILEQFLLGYREKYKASHIRPDELLPSIDNYFRPLMEKYNWGFNYTYMLSGINNIHQSYCQYLSQENRFNIPQISEILSGIPEDKRSKFDKEALDETILKILVSDDDDPTNNIPIYHSDEKIKSVLIVAGGPSLRKISDIVPQFLIENKSTLIECNHTGFFDNMKDREIVILNRMKLENYLNRFSDHPTIITGEVNIANDFSERKNIYRMPFSLGELKLEKENVSLPDYDAGMFSIAYALKKGSKNIFLAGFDGFENAGMNSRMDAFFESLEKILEGYGVRFRSITPTRYRDLKETSIYALI